MKSETKRELRVFTPGTTAQDREWMEWKGIDDFASTDMARVAISSVLEPTVPQPTMVSYDTVIAKLTRSL